MANDQSSLREKIADERWLQKSGVAPRSRLHVYNVIAQHTLDGDLGLLENQPAYSGYDLDEETRDRLLAHTRQDASLAVIVASHAENQVRQVKWLLLLALALLSYIAFGK